MLAVGHDQHKSKATSFREAIKLLKRNSELGGWVVQFLGMFETAGRTAVIFYRRLLLNVEN